MNLQDLAAAAQAGPSGAASLKLFFLLTVLSFAPALVLSVTSFVRIIIVLSFLRQGLGTPQLPPNQVLIGLALFMTAFLMRPTLQGVYDNAVKPYLDDQIGYEEAANRGGVVLKGYLLPHTREQDLALFLDIAALPAPANIDEVPISVSIPAYMVSELTAGFRMGLSVLLPFAVIDLLVAAVMMSLGMMMVPPQMVGLPLKLGVFLAADGWHLVVATLARGIHG
ncbi:MAG: flagellar type III secretion system pore protein FliP [Deltaproteobacteria bacterium]|nr:flagellar type III secretion system pore protein FliP [Deltaproteobacteria bacterium]